MTLDEEIREIAEDAATNLGAFSDLEIRIVESAIYAGIEAWKRQEPTEEMIEATILLGVSSVHIGTIYRAMMSASLRTSETTGEG